MFFPKSSNGNHDFDVSTPAVLFQVGSYPFQHGSLGAIRSLGRLGVPTYLIAKNRLAPHRLSRYLQRQFRFDILSKFDDQASIAYLRQIAEWIGGRAVLIPTDDEAAVFVARTASELTASFLLPSISPTLPAILASKRELYLECVKHGVPAPKTAYAETVLDAYELIANASYPVVVKNSEPWSRLMTPAVASTTIVNSPSEFTKLCRSWRNDPKVVIQEYIPRQHAQDWIVHAYCDRDGKLLVAFTGRKYRSWPPGAGVTTMATAERNDALQTMATEFCAAVGFSGIVDMDWRYDDRDRKYKLIDFNPRLGANFRLFATGDGIDVARALYLDLTGQPVPRAAQDFNRQFRVENLDLISRLAEVGQNAPRPGGRRTTEYAWFAADDPLPFLAMALRFGGQSIKRLYRIATGATGTRLGLPPAVSPPREIPDVN